MCGRYTHLYSWAELNAALSFVVPSTPITARYNVAPTQLAPVIRRADDGRNHVEFLKWGLIPKWAKDPKIGSSLINARAETLNSKPAFKEAYATKRCLVPITGFYEWAHTEGKKQPYYFTATNSQPLFLAGLWETWQNPDQKTIENFLIITTEANDTVRPIHDRMPVIIDTSNSEKWLDTTNTTAEINSLLRPVAANVLQDIPVDPCVNNARHDSSDCIIRRNSL
jgi:putative SOS response-associated peptidase YedK